MAVRTFRFIKSWTNWLYEPALLKLSDRARALFFFAYLLAGRAEDNGRLSNGGRAYTVADLGVLFLRSDKDIQRAIDELCEAGFLTVNSEGIWITRFEDEQGPVDDPARIKTAERMRRYRERKSAGNAEGEQTQAHADTRDTVWANDIFVRVTGFPMIPPRQRAEAIEVILALRSRFLDEEEQIAYMKRKFELWQNTKGKDGRYYSKNNLGWLLDWCVTDGGEDTTEDDGWEVL